MAWLLLLEKLLMHNGSCLKDKEKLMVAYMNMKEVIWREFYGPGLIPDLISHWVNPFTTKISLLILLAVFHTTDPQIDIFFLFSSLICLILYFLFKGEIMSCPTCCFPSSLKFSPPQKPNTPITNLALMPLQMNKLKHNNSHCSLLFVCAFEK